MAAAAAPAPGPNQARAAQAAPAAPVAHSSAKARWIAPVAPNPAGGRVSLGDALVVVPLAMAAAYFPFSVGGAGVREGAFVVLCTTALSMSRADALASSLLLWMTQLAVAAFGGLAQLFWPLEARER